MKESLAILEALGVRPILVDNLNADGLILIEDGLVLIRSGMSDDLLDRVVEQVVSAAMDEFFEEVAR